MEHMKMICERFTVVHEVGKRINLSKEEEEGLLAMKVEGSITCNCWRRRNHELARQREVLERLVTDAVLKVRGLRARKAIGAAVRLDEKGAIEGDSGQEAQIIRIDFRKRMRIIE